MWIWVPVALATAALMEFWAGLLHGAVWHRALWPLHKSHHVPHASRFEWNDLLSGLHAPLAVALILYGCVAAQSVGREVAYGVGLGMSAFGLLYLVFHDGLVHGRLPVGRLKRFAYFRRLCDAHEAHHRGSARGHPFGFFLGPWELHRANQARQRVR